MSTEEIKKKVGETAAGLIESGMLVGIGTGSTVHYFIQSLGERCRQGLKIHAIASSLNSMKQAQKGGIPLLNSSEVTSLDLTIDGTDEIDHAKRMIKGGGGALVREKIIATMSREMVVICDETKLVPYLGKAKLPVEVIPFAEMATLHQMKKLGYTGELRTQPDQSLFVTDNGNYIIDIHFSEVRQQPEKDHEALIQIPGVVETGFFFNLAGRVIVGFFDGQLVIKN